MLPPSFRPYFFDNGLMAPHGMNDILFTAEFKALGGDLPQEMIISAINKHYDSQWNLVNSDGSEVISHDNLTALYCISQLANLPKPGFKPEHAYLHPRDFFFYMWASGGVLGAIGTLFLWIPFLCMVESVLNTTYKNIDGQDVMATDGKLLTWLRINSFNLPITKWICDRIVKWKYGSYQSFFDLYFKDPNHPNRVLAAQSPRVLF